MPLPKRTLIVFTYETKLDKRFPETQFLLNDIDFILFGKAQIAGENQFTLNIAKIKIF